MEDFSNTGFFKPAPKQWMGVRIEVVEGTILIYVDEIEFIKFTDSDPLTKGLVGFSVIETSTVWFDDVRVVELTPE